MGAMRFLVPRRERMAADAVERATFSGIDEIPWHTRTQWTDQGLVVERAESDSGNFSIPCPVAGHGQLMLSTGQPDGARAALPFAGRAGPRHAQSAAQSDRAAGNRWAWSSRPRFGSGWPRRTPICRGPSPARKTRKPPPIAPPWRLGLALEAIDLLSASYVEQALAARHHQSGKLSTLLGFNLDSARPTDAMAAKLCGRLQHGHGAVRVAQRSKPARESATGP